MANMYFLTFACSDRSTVYAHWKYHYTLTFDVHELFFNMYTFYVFI